MANHLPSLDGLRGVAAVSILIAHTQGVAGAQMLPQAHLGVDFFFLLSGFVIGRAYEDRMAAGMGFGRYMQIRIARLYPMIFVGAMLGLLFALLKPGDFPVWIALLGQLLCIPFLAGPGAFPLDGAQWSLFYELVVNAAHALGFRALGNKVLAVIVALSFVALVYTTRKLDTLDLGWDIHQVWGGAVRVTFSFSLGLLIYRVWRDGKLQPPTVPYWVIVAALFLVLLPPTPGLRTGLREGVTVAFIFPTLLAFALTAKVRARNLAAYGGNISYPLYLIHGPFLYLCSLAPSQEHPTAYWFCAGTFAIVVATFVEWAYDAPIRARLRPFMSRGAEGSSSSPSSSATERA